jgi:hypothetical protein
MELTFSIFFEIFHVYGLVATELSDLAHTNIIVIKNESKLLTKEKKLHQRRSFVWASRISTLKEKINDLNTKPVFDSLHRQPVFK